MSYQIIDLAEKMQDETESKWISPSDKNTH